MKLNHLLYLVCFALLASCSEGETRQVFNGKLNHSYIVQQNGFGEQKTALLSKHSMTPQEFIALSTVRVSDLSEVQRSRLKVLRNDLTWPNSQTLLQKIVPLSDLATYMENVYGGTVGGFVCIAADVKNLNTMYDIFWGLRLDYSETKFKENGAGYVAIRFYSSTIDKLTIPYSTEMGGTITDPFPFGGGGFTTAKLGSGGFPEYKFTQYTTPTEGAELYEYTPTGKEILRSVFTNGKWIAYEGETVKTKSVETLSVTPRYINYKGHQLYLRGATTEGAHLFSFDPQTASQLGMELYDKGEYRLIVPMNEITTL